jgi:beta-glucosidase
MRPGYHLRVSDLPISQIPAGFAWGVATAAYQIEGAVAEDGRGDSVWDTFCRRPGAIRDGHTGDIADDHYHRWREDVGLMADLGVTAYRFSIGWPRVQPTGSGAANEPGLDFYDRLTDALLAAGITPMPTLFHWDLPQPLEEAGGWLSRDTAARFADYAALAAGRPTAHHQLLGHGLATQALRAAGVREVMITNNYSPAWPASDSQADVQAAHAWDTLQNRLFTDPVLTGRYPELSGLGLSAQDQDFVMDGDLAAISAPIDGLGVNYYMPTKVAAAGADSPMPIQMETIEGYPVTAFGWPVVPAGLTDILVQLHTRYGDRLPPVYITENGCSTADQPAEDGSVDDQARISYLDSHIRAVGDAITAGVDVRGYLAWSLMDNFEWAEGYHQRFGLVRVDYETLRRTPKASFFWYRDVIAATQPS